MSNLTHFKELFSTVQPGFEAALEEEIQARFPGSELIEARTAWRVFRLPEPFTPEALAQAPSIFARSWGVYLGPEDPRADQVGPAVTLHCWARREFLPGAREKRPIPIDVELRAEALREELPQRGFDLRPSGARVLNAIRRAPDDWVWGLHVPAPDRLPFPGNEYPWPEGRIPSRAYLKCREALHWSQAETRPGECAIELGCSPGGALLALLETGLDVVGVDPGALDPQVEIAARSAERKLVHHRMRAEKIDPREFPEKVDWLLSDMNVAPEFLLALIQRWLPVLAPRGLKGLFLTLKLTDRSFIQGLRSLQRQLRADWSPHGVSDVRIRQLSQNRAEVQLFADFRGKG